MKQRLGYRGGARQQDRMVADKLWSMSGALTKSYQGATVERVNPNYDPDATEGIESLEFLQFRALINPDKLKPEYDDKIISIPFKDVCLNAPRVGKTSIGKIDTNFKPGLTFRWVDNNTWWIIYLQYLEEYAYFRGDIYACEDNIAEVNDKTYHVYFRGPDQFTIDWHTKHHNYLNDLNYTKIMYITKDDNTLDYFHRFTIIYVNGDPWEVVAKNENYADGIILVHMREYYHNTAQDARDAEVEQKEKEAIPISTDIIGNKEVMPYETVTYSAPYQADISWNIINISKGTKINIVSSEQNGDICNLTITIASGKSGQFTLVYGDQTLPVKVLSL